MYFHSRDPKCKQPFGAVPVGSDVTLTLLRDSGDDFVGATAVFTDDFSGHSWEIAMTPCTGGFSVTTTVPGEATLLWYHFRLTQPDGYVRHFGKYGLDNCDSHQLTVYRPEAIPRWFGRGVTYQIFPDRFHRLAVPSPDGLIGDRVIHRDWREEPVFGPDEQGIVRNNDFFGGSLRGITAKLDYLRSLSVSTVYLNPIFMAASNHRYDTADYMTIDPLLGNEDDLRELCREAHKRDIHIMLDGVFNHTGSDSIYFNAKGSFDTLGAAQSLDSPFASWFNFQHHPDQYDAWWGIRTLPAVNENDSAYREYIITGENSVVRHYLRCGIDGWRLDVADELPDDFIEDIRRVMAEENPDAFLLGEVWEDASNKVAYSRRRKYLLGGNLCGVMNYPLRSAILDYVRGGPAQTFRDAMETLRENYPPQAYYSCMNLLGTHDTPRLLTALGVSDVPGEKWERAVSRLTPEEYILATERLRMAATLQYCLPGSPTVYYGDEVGQEGFEDPFCRRTFPWGDENDRLLAYYQRLGIIRHQRKSLQDGAITFLAANEGYLCFRRTLDDEVTVCAINRSDESLSVTIPWTGLTARDLPTGQYFLARNGQVQMVMPPRTAVVLG